MPTKQTTKKIRREDHLEGTVKNKKMKFVEYDEDGNKITVWKDVSSGFDGKDIQGRPVPVEGQNPRSVPKGKKSPATPAQKV